MNKFFNVSCLLSSLIVLSACNGEGLSGNNDSNSEQSLSSTALSSNTSVSSAQSMSSLLVSSSSDGLLSSLSSVSSEPSVTLSSSSSSIDSVVQSNTFNIDLQADVNRDGRIDERDDEAAEADSAGVIVLPNLDDDSLRCNESKSIGSSGRIEETDAFIGCNDASDFVSNGEADIEDLSLVTLSVMGEVTSIDTFQLRLFVNEKEDTSGKFRVLAKRDEQFVDITREPLKVADIADGIVLGLEATDVLRDQEQWSGRATLRAEITVDGAQYQDELPLVVAPIVTQHDLGRVEKLFVSPPPLPENGQTLADEAAQVPPSARSMGYGFVSQRFINGLRTASTGIVDELLMLTDAAGDVWAQDYFEPAFVARPGASGPQIIRLMLRSANLSRLGDQVDFSILPQFQGLTREEIVMALDNLSDDDYFAAEGRARQAAREAGVGQETSDSASFREAGIALYSQIRGKDIGVVQIEKQELDLTAEDTYNSTGNFTTIPPSPGAVSTNPHGRMVYGSTPNPRFITLLKAQQFQTPIRVPTEWLLVGHVDEFLTFLPSSANARGWIMGVADPSLAYELLEKAYAQSPLSTLLKGAYSLQGSQVSHAEQSVNDVLNDKALRDANDFASKKIEESMKILREQLNLADEDIVKLPALYKEVPFGGSTANSIAVTAFSPNGVNGLHLGNNTFISPKQFGPIIDGEDQFQKAYQDTLAPHGINVLWVDDYAYAHLGEGEIHCVTNATRDLEGAAAWW